MENGEIEISLEQIFRIIKRRLSWIIAVTLICALAAFVISAYFITPKYTATTTLYVHVDIGSSYTTTQISTGKALAKTYGVIITSDRVLDKVKDILDLDMSTSTLKKCISTSALDDTEILSISVKHDSPEIAQAIANALANSVPEEIIDIVKVGNAEIIDYAKLPTIKSSPSISKNVAIGAIMGLVVSCAFFIIIAIFDNKIRSEDDLTQAFELPVYGSVPTINSKNTEGKKNA